MLHIPLHRYLVKQKHVDSSGNSEGGSNHDIQPPPAKKRRRGQNKHRPRCRIPYSEQLCSSLHLHGGAGVTCPFGENCRYMHDVEKYMASKPEDLGDRCFLFETYGRCSYGPACRFGGSHLSARFENIVNEAIFVPDRPASTVNVLSKRLQEQLRKRTLAFPRSDAYLRQLAKQTKRTNSHKPSLSSAGVPSNKSALASADCSLQSSVTSSGSEMQSFTDSVANSCSSVTTTGSSNGPCFTESETSSVQSFTEESKATVACDIQIKTCGAVTDEDHIKLRPQEKKKVWQHSFVCIILINSIILAHPFQFLEIMGTRVNYLLNHEGFFSPQVDFRDKLFLAPLTTVRLCIAKKCM